MSTSDPAPKTARKRTTKRVTKGTTKKAAAKAVAKPDQLSPEAQAVVTQVDNAVKELIARHQEQPQLNGPATVILQMQVDFAVTPTDAVNDAIGQLVDQGLTKWAWLVHDEQGVVHVVSNGVLLNEEDMESFGA